ncbi:MAG: tRNA (adenosine(37)-N6)-dimethylallyltransferase MiaA [Proteobacteria bacterium]|nr:tRNA (adenosine(37)-N6)-dimethylallyltransferase MiaA [Pseudomonadota bacterium]
MKKSEAEPILIIAGPTASGKSALALDAAEEFTGTVINADSMQVYRELRVLTARPTDGDEARAPHRLFGALPVTEACSAGRWLGMARAEIEAARGAGRLPILVGGTGLYLKALTDGLAPVPGIPQGVRSEARRLHARLGGEAFRAELAKVDAEAARRLDAGDSQRLIRAFEVVRATGRPLADWQRQGAGGPATDARFATIVLAPPRDALYAAIDARLDTMIEEGALDEVAALDRLGLDAGLPAAKAVGVPELRRHLRGEITLDEALDSAKRASRNFAKRQLTWLRHQMPGAHVVSAQYSESLRPEIFSFICQFLLTGRP